MITDYRNGGVIDIELQASEKIVEADVSLRSLQHVTKSGVNQYAKVLLIPTFGFDTPLKAGMVFAFEPNCAIGKKVVNLGGTVIVGDDGGIELNDISTQLMRA